MKSSLREQFEQLAQRPAVPRTLCGSPADLRLTVPRGVRMSRPIDAITGLRDCGLTLREAKTAYETLLEQCELTLYVPGVSDILKLKAFLADCGITAEELQHART